ncbi:MAG: maltokinase N-terminal cap-like domain-containing protein, partial [Angustibacter sp.]
MTPMDAGAGPNGPGYGQDLVPWISAQRWFLSSGRGPQLRPLGFQALPSAAGSAELGIWFFIDGPGRQGPVYQVPVVSYPNAQPHPDAALIAVVQHAGRELWLYD